MTNPAYVAVDWGTSSFRLWLIGRDGSVLAERRSGRRHDERGQKPAFPPCLPAISPPSRHRKTCR